MVAFNCQKDVRLSKKEGSKPHRDIIVNLTNKYHK